MLRTTLKIVIAVLAIIIITVTLLSISHPIIPKWMTGTARILGRPVNATVYANGIKNDNITVYRVNKYWGGGDANNYLLVIKENVGRLKFISINLNERWVGVTAGATKRDYDFVGGLLLQSEIGGQFTPLTDDMKGYNFNARLIFSDKQIQFNLPARNSTYDSIRIELAK